MTLSHNPSSQDDAATGRAAGGFLLAMSVLIVFTMGHHPTGHDGGAVMAGLSLSALVHSAMTAFWAINLWAFAIYMRRRGAGGLTLAGFIAYALSGIGHLLAALISGAITPGLAARIDVAASHDLFVLTWSMNQSYAAFGVYFTGAAYVLWGLALIWKATGLNRMLGALGVVLGVLPALALLAGWVSLNVHGAFLIYGGHSLFAAIVGIQMLRGRL